MSSRLPRQAKLFGAVSLLNDFASEMIYPLLPAFVTGVLARAAGRGRLLHRRGGATDHRVHRRRVAGDRPASGGPAGEGTAHAAARRADRGRNARGAARSGVRAAARDGPRGRGAGAARRLVSARLAAGGCARGDRMEPGAGRSGSHAGDLGGKGRGRTGRDEEGRRTGRCAFPVVPRPPPSFPVRPPCRDLSLLSPPHARHPDHPTLARAWRPRGCGAAVVGGGARGAIVVELRGRGVGDGLCRIRRRGVGVVPRPGARGRPHREPGAGVGGAAGGRPRGERVRHLSRRDGDGGLGGRPGAGRGVPSPRCGGRVSRKRRRRTGSRARLAGRRRTPREGNMKPTMWFAVVLLVITAPLGAQERQVIHGPGAVQGLPFSPAVRVGNMLYLSGQIGNLPGTRQLADTGIAGQTRQALENVKALLLAAGSSLDRGVKCAVFLTEIRDYGKMNDMYATYFPQDPPARSTVAGSGLALGARVEIECMAVVGS